VEFLERGELPGDALDEIGEALGLGVVGGDGEDVDRDAHGRVSGALVLVEGGEDGLGADDDHLGLADDLARGGIACSNWSRRIGLSFSECGLSLVLGE
jgi:hypothetical protein